MIEHTIISNRQLRGKIRRHSILFAGNKKLKVYGRMCCWSGKRMKKKNRVFFSSETEAKQHGYRPCGHCMKSEYAQYIVRRSK